MTYIEENGKIWDERSENNDTWSIPVTSEMVKLAMGLGKALCYATMNVFEEQENLPVYIHTQPWSWKAIFLYLSLGFKLQKTDTFAHYENEYYKVMTELKQIVTEKQFELLQELSES